MNNRTYIMLLAVAYQSSIHAKTETGIPTLDWYEEHTMRQEKNAKASTKTKPAPIVEAPKAATITKEEQPLEAVRSQFITIITPDPIVVAGSLSLNSHYRNAVQEKLREYEGSVDITDLEQIIVDEKERLAQEELSWFQRWKQAHPVISTVTPLAACIAVGYYVGNHKK